MELLTLVINTIVKTVIFVGAALGFMSFFMLLNLLPVLIK